MPYQDVREMFRTKPMRWVSGYFDPLLAEHVRRLAHRTAPGQLLVVEIADPPTPLLPQRARAELVAALSMVDYVVLGNGQPAEEILDADVTAEFIEHVVRRHRAEEAG